MNATQFSELVFFIAAIWWTYRGITLLSQSLHHEQHITWYKRFKLTRGFYYLFLGLGGMITGGVNFTGVSMPLGDTSWYLLLVLLGVPMLLFGILSLSNKSQTAFNNQQEKSVLD